MSVGAIEPQFYAALLEGMGLAADDLPGQMEQATWRDMKERFAAVFKTKSRDEWTEIFDGKDACVAPVLSMSEAHTHPHNMARGTFVEAFGARHPNPTPRFSRTKAEIVSGPSGVGEHTDEILAEIGYDEERVAKLRSAGVIA